METEDNLIGRRALLVGSAGAAAALGLGALGELPAEAAVRPRSGGAGAAVGICKAGAATGAAGVGANTGSGGSA